MISEQKVIIHLDNEQGNIGYKKHYETVKRYYAIINQSQK